MNIKGKENEGSKREKSHYLKGGRGKEEGRKRKREQISPPKSWRPERSGTFRKCLKKRIVSSEFYTFEISFRNEGETNTFWDEGKVKKKKKSLPAYLKKNVLKEVF